MRRRGVAAIQQRQELQEKFQIKGDEIDSKKLENFTEQLNIFVEKLEGFSARNKNGLKNDPTLRRNFQEMCANVGVDPLASSKGFWSEILGVGDFYYELSIQIIEVCLAKSSVNGGLITMNELRECLQKSRSKTRKEVITTDDIVRSIKKLEAFGSGFELIKLSDGNFLVQSTPGELNTDSIQVLQIAKKLGGRITKSDIKKGLTWEDRRTEHIIEQLIKEGRIWVDAQGSGTTYNPEYWFPLFFLDNSNEKS